MERRAIREERRALREERVILAGWRDAIAWPALLFMAALIGALGGVTDLRRGWQIVGCPRGLKGRNWLGEVQGRWPGEESEEELLNFLKEGR